MRRVRDFIDPPDQDISRRALFDQHHPVEQRVLKDVAENCYYRDLAQHQRDLRPHRIVGGLDKGRGREHFLLVLHHPL